MSKLTSIPMFMPLKTDTFFKLTLFLLSSKTFRTSKIFWPSIQRKLTFLSPSKSFFPSMSSLTSRKFLSSRISLTRNNTLIPTSAGVQFPFPIKTGTTFQIILLVLITTVTFYIFLCTFLPLFLSTPF